MCHRSLRAGILALGVLMWGGLIGATASAQEARVSGIIKRVDVARNRLHIEPYGVRERFVTRLTDDVVGADSRPLSISELKPGLRVTVVRANFASRVVIEPEPPKQTLLAEFWNNFRHNLFKPLLLFFYLGFLIAVLRVEFEFPYAMYQALTIYLLIAIGWRGGEELAELGASALGPVLGFMAVGFCMNFGIGILAYFALSVLTKMRRVDKATVAGYYGSDSAGTFVTCAGVLATSRIVFDAYMPVMLAVMEIPGCLVALYLVSRLRARGMDARGTMPDEPGYDPTAVAAVSPLPTPSGPASDAIEDEKMLALEKTESHLDEEIERELGPPTTRGHFNWKLLHEVFLNPGLFLLFGGIAIGFISRLQGPEVTREDDNFFLVLFQGVLCLFLLEMGMTAARKLRDLRTAGIGYIAFGLIAPNVFATLGIVVAHAYAVLTHTAFQPGTYVLFSVLCAAASYIAVPAVQRLAIPEASPTLPLAASLGLTFSYNVTIGIPVYILIAKAVTTHWPG